MAYIVKEVKAFDKGIISTIGDQVIPNGATSNSQNFLDLGDKIELMRGSLRMGEELTAAGRVTGLHSATDIDGNEYLYRVRDTNLELYDEDADSWTIIKSDLTDDKDISFANYRSPAGAFVYIIGPYDGPLRINLANPSSVVNLYNSSKNYKGYLTIQDNRSFVWQKLGDETVLYLSWIDNDYPYTQITNEARHTGDGTTATFTGTIAHPLVVGRSFSINDGTETFTEDGSGVLTGSLGGVGTLNYTTGVYSITFNTAPANLAAIRATYRYEQPTSEGLLDFTYASTRVAGTGDFLFQSQNSDELEFVFAYDEKFYCFHKRSIWVLDLTSDDTNATNKVYRENTGISNWRSAVATGDGIYYIDDSPGSKKTARILAYNDLAAKVLPQSVSDQFSLDDFEFDDAACIEYGDYIVWACKSSSDAENNDTMLLYNKKWKLWNKVDGLYRCFTIFNGKLYGGSSVNGNVYELFSGFDDDESAIYGTWEANDWDLETDELKKCKKIVVEGDMASSQELIVEASFDEQDWQELGRVAGDSEYVQRSSTTMYGTIMYGTGAVGANEPVTAYRYMREFKIGSTKFYRLKIRFRTESLGYLSVKQYTFRDVRLKGHKLPAMFR